MFFTRLTLGLFFAAFAAEAKVAVDFGYRGNTQEIAEQSMKDRFTAAIKDINLTSMKMQAEAGLANMGTAKAGIPSCEENLTRMFEPGITLKKDYFAPNGKLLAKAGQKINPLSNPLFEYIKRKIYLVDGTSKRQIQHVKESCDKSNCVIFITKGNSFAVSKLMEKQAYPLPEPFARALDARCALSVYLQQGSKFEVQEISLPEKPDAQ